MAKDLELKEFLRSHILPGMPNKTYTYVIDLVIILGNSLLAQRDKINQIITDDYDSMVNVVIDPPINNVRTKGV